jgi:hypothetical protein
VEIFAHVPLRRSYFEERQICEEIGKILLVSGKILLVSVWWLHGFLAGRVGFEQFMVERRGSKDAASLQQPRKKLELGFNLAD